MKSNVIKLVLIFLIMMIKNNNDCSAAINLMNQFTSIKCTQINSACKCAKPGPPDLGIVYCDQNLKLASLNNHFFFSARSNQTPSDRLFVIYNPQLSIYKITFKQNGIRQLHNLTFQRTGIYNLEIIDQKLIYLPNKCFFGLERTLRTLSLESNQLINVPTLALSGLRKLNFLNLNHNRIRRLASDQLLPNSLQNTLKTLFLANNQLAHIDAFTFQNLNALQHLDLSSNNLIFLNDCAFCSQTSLTTSHSKLLFLNLASNRLSAIPFALLASSLPNLQALNLASNLISSANEDENYKPICLEYLNLEGNQLSALTNQSFARFSCLRILSLASNEIQSIDDNTFKNVEINELNLRNCKLAKLTSGVFNGKANQLTQLDLSENRLDYQQENDTLIGLDKLTSFKFNNNIGKFQLSPLLLAQSQYSLVEFEFAQPHSANGSQLNEQFNPINYEIEFKNLRRLSLSFFNKLEKKQLLAYGDYNLHYLDLSRSWLENLNDKDLFESVPWLLHLNLSFNNIKRLNSNLFSPLGSTLVSLDLNSAFHSSFSHTFNCDLFKHLSSLRTLSLIENNIFEFEKASSCFDALSELRLLQLDFNYLSKLKPNQFDQLKSLVHLQLSNNNLNQLDTNTFNELPKLVYISLAFNQLKNIKQSAFSDLISLRYIDLSNNQLQMLEPDAFINLPYLEYINFNKNQLKQFSWISFDQVGE